MLILSKYINLSIYIRNEKLESKGNVRLDKCFDRRMEVLLPALLENHDTPEDQPTNRRTLSMRICVLEIRSVKEIHANKLQIEMLLIKKKCVDNSIASHIKYQLKWHLQRYKVASKCTERTERFVLGLQGMCTQREYVFYVVKESSIS